MHVFDDDVLCAGFGATDNDGFSLSVMPSFAIFGVDVTFSMHGLNFAPGGAECELCDNDGPDGRAGPGASSTPA